MKGRGKACLALYPSLCVRVAAACVRARARVVHDG